MIKKSIAAGTAVVVAGFLIGQFVMMLGPAVAREHLAACNGLKPSALNDAFAGHPLVELPLPAPDFAAQDIDGNMRRLSDFRGEVVFLNFWANWCPPCKEEVPSIEELQETLGDDGFVVLAMASSRDWKSALADFHDEGTPMTVLLDPPTSEDEQIGDIAKAYGVPALPETFIIDKQGYIRYYFVNKRDWKSDVAVTCMRSLIEEEESLPWLRSWLWTMSQTSFGSS